MNKVLFTFFIISYCLTILVNCLRPAECELPRKVGRCRAAFPSYYFNSQLNKCELFMYGGCEGNENRFATEQQCIQRCGSGSTRVRNG